MKNASSRLAGSLLLLACLAGCRAPGSPAPAAAGELVLEPRSLTRETAGCAREGEPACARVVMRWLEPSGSGPAAAAIREWIDAFVRRSETGETEELLGSAEAVADRFLAAFEETLADFPDLPGGWELRRSVAQLHRDERLLSLEAGQSAYAGGAHPNSHQALATFDLRTGRRLGLADLLRSGWEEPLRAAAEARFRSALSVAPDQSLADAGFWFEDSRFVLPEDFAVVGDGLAFHWDPYAVAPYSAGPIDFAVPLSEVAAFLRPDGPLGSAVAR